jgi:hypothetical protein
MEMNGILTPETLALFLYFVVPGIVLVKVYDLIVPTTRRDASAAFLDALAYSFMILTVGLWPYLLLVTAQKDLAGWLYYLLLFILTLILVFFLPSGLAIWYYHARTKGFLQNKVPDPTPTPWDWFFSGKGAAASLDSETAKPACYLRFHLKEGDDLGGYFGKYSLASSFPNAQQVYVEEAWRLHEDGSFAEPVASTTGAVVNLDECELVEFVAIELSSNNGENANTEGDPRQNGGQG